MKIIFISNYLNNHQTELCGALYKMEGVDFCFLQTEEMTEERVKLGWKINESEYPYFKDASTLSKKQLKALIFTADVIIYGDSAIDITRFVLKRDALVLYYCERLFKRGKVGFLRRLKCAYKYRVKNRRIKKAVLCASAYASYDFSLFGAFKGRRYKWGYFPKFNEYDINELSNAKIAKPLKLLWVGRIIDWKRTIDVVSLAEKLKCENVDFTLEIVGTGDLEGEIKSEIISRNLSDCVKMTGSLPQSQTRKKMEEASVLIVTSDKNEGWGVVVNEGLNAGCVCICSNAVGSAPYLIKHGENGYLYEACNVDDMKELVVHLYDNAELIKKLSISAYQTLNCGWTPEISAKRLVKLIDCLKRGKDTPYDSGICSKAEIIKYD
ncbi:MAG: glycosyltransferase [Clostridia bacterium]|nr:glycosyltransferase [Clostridia bacterium]